MAQKQLLSGDPFKIAAAYKQSLLKNGLPVQQLIIFGSYAKGNPRWDSDLDIAVVDPSYDSWSIKDQMEAAAATLSVDTTIEPHIIGTKELQNPYNSLAVEILTHGIVV